MKQGSVLWEICHSPYPSPFLIGSQQFGKLLPVYLIDQFNGKRPSVINEELISTGSYDFEMWPSALLDSNILGAIEKRVFGQATHDGLEEFLRFLTQRNWDYSPLFYYMEHFSKSARSDFVPNAVRRTEALLHLQSMDEDHFLQSGEIVANAAAVAQYKETVGASTLLEVAEHRVTSFADKYDRQALTSIMEATQVALIKMVLIHKRELRKSSPARKYEEFFRFLRDDLGIILARELHFALHYFCDRAGGLLGIQSNTPIDKALKTIQSTAWDVYLLRFPEILFATTPSEQCVAYVATQEKKLHELARLFFIERIQDDIAEGFAPHVSYDASLIPAEVIAAIPSQVGRSTKFGDFSERNISSVPVGLLSAMERELGRFLARPNI